MIKGFYGKGADAPPTHGGADGYIVIEPRVDRVGWPIAPHFHFYTERTEANEKVTKIMENGGMCFLVAGSMFAALTEKQGA